MSTIEKVVTIATVREAIGTKIAASGPDVFEAVAQKLANDELDKRIALVLQYYTEIDNADKELRKLKEDLWNGTGFSGFTKDTFEKREKINVRRTKVEKAIHDALNNNDFAALKNLGDNKDVPKT